MALASKAHSSDSENIREATMETVKRIIDWLASEELGDPSTAPDEVVFEIDSLEDAARIAMGTN
jgi:hypothetical protein